jgi:predicted DNA binding CopG/RHH family protein
MTNKYNKEELEIINYIENANPKSVKNLEKRISEITKSTEIKVSKRKPISIRILEDDLRKIKRQALDEGIPYQTLIGSIIHKYLNGNLILKNF